MLNFFMNMDGFVTQKYKKKIVTEENRKKSALRLFSHCLAF